MDDLISRQAAIKSIEERAKKIKNGDTLNGLAGAVGILFELPSVKPQEPTGHWIDTGSGQECSKCREIQYGYDNHRFYCGNCGARMLEEPTGSESEDKE